MQYIHLSGASDIPNEHYKVMRVFINLEQDSTLIN